MPTAPTVDFLNTRKPMWFVFDSQLLIGIYKGQPDSEAVLADANEQWPDHVPLSVQSYTDLCAALTPIIRKDPL